MQAMTTAKSATKKAPEEETKHYADDALLFPPYNATIRELHNNMPTLRRLIKPRTEPLENSQATRKKMAISRAIMS